MLDALKAHGEMLRQYFEDVVSDWSPENRPVFVLEVKAWANELRVIVKPKRTRSRKGKAQPAEIFEFVDKGTRPHVIKPKKSNKKQRLVFVWGGPGSYQANTLPVAQAHAGPGAVVGGKVVSFPKVNHPGSEARLFSETVEAATYEEFRRKTEAAFRRMERESNRRRKR